MTTATSDFVKVASMSDLPEGEAKAVRVKGRSVALFHHKGRVYATDNQCPHMGYPLTRGRVRDGVLTCDWHGWTYDMKGGGCFTGGCDDLDTFPVEVQNGQILVNVDAPSSKHQEADFLLLQEGHFTEDNWTLSKAIAILLARGVSEQQTLKLLVKHMGRHIATEDNVHRAGHHLSLMVNGVTVARRYEPDDRLIPLTMAASGAAGRAADRSQIQPLPPPVTWEKLEDWIRVFARDKKPESIEKCLITARRLGKNDQKIVPLLLECAVEPHFLGHSDNLTRLGYLGDLLEEFGWDEVEQLVCSLAAKILGQHRGAPRGDHRTAIEMFGDIEKLIDDLDPSSESKAPLDVDTLTEGLLSGDLQKTFTVVSDALKSGAGIDAIVDTMVLLAADRMARTPVNMSPGWGNLSREMSLASAVRVVQRYAGPRVAARGLYHAAWQFFEDRWLNIPARSLQKPLEDEKSDAASEDASLERVMEAVASIQVRQVGRLARQHLNSFGGERLLHELGRSILQDDTGWHLLHTLRTVGDEWPHCGQQLVGKQLLIGLSRFATHSRKQDGTQSAALTAQRFASGATAADLYE